MPERVSRPGPGAAGAAAARWFAAGDRIVPFHAVEGLREVVSGGRPAEAWRQVLAVTD